MKLTNPFISKQTIPKQDKNTHKLLPIKKWNSMVLTLMDKLSIWPRHVLESHIKKITSQLKRAASGKRFIMKVAFLANVA